MNFRRCDKCGRRAGPRVNICPDCGGDIRVTLTEPGHGQIEYLIRRTPPPPDPLYSTSSTTRRRRP